MTDAFTPEHEVQKWLLLDHQVMTLAICDACGDFTEDMDDVDQPCWKASSDCNGKVREGVRLICPECREQDEPEYAFDNLNAVRLHIEDHKMHNLPGGALWWEQPHPDRWDARLDEGVHGRLMVAIRLARMVDSIDEAAVNVYNILSGTLEMSSHDVYKVAARLIAEDGPARHLAAEIPTENVGCRKESSE